MKILAFLLVALFMTPPKSVYEFKMQSIDGNKIDLSAYKGKKILIVNTASKCGFTKQYAGLEELSKKYKDKLVVIGFPEDNFKQELSSNELIKEFCKANYGVTFLLSEKVSVKGDDQTALFKYLTTAENPDFEGDINWNFEKFLIDENGKLIHRFRSKTEPLSPELTKYL
ncbi:Glutathione peroxidase [Arcticibacter svalbardensis MN12-7]|uniref:Glutathione peroxidase n=1 Tax=Arcticibacter svalbardensis MN12-7 TaxID=1150600 RepID=R9GLZ3_9SPHI|nr:glutathione peroxidase [Arcticibacter svalbardensis]EOR92701.1 Glutathione peroxidase [Arcticibacter svalbardensis MN12-7]